MPGAISPSDETIDELAQFYRRGQAGLDERLGIRLQDKADEITRDSYNRGLIGPWDRLVWNQPDISKPSEFVRSPLIVSSDDDFTRDATRLMDALDPYTKSNVDQVTVGPTRTSMNFQANARKPLGSYDGMTGASGYGGIGISPNIDAREKILTLIHELGHIAYPNTKQDKANEAEAIYNRMQPPDEGRKVHWSHLQIRNPRPTVPAVRSR